MWYRGWIAILVMGLCLSACAEIISTEPQWDGSDVMGSTVWYLVELNGDPVERTDVTIQYENLNLAGNGFCAVYRIAPVTTGAETIRIDTVATPPQECAADDTQHERDFIAALIATTTIAVVDNNLVFRSATGQSVLVFAP
jgi:heat shock protein HslJ